MSVVAEDPTMVKYLLDQGVEIHEKCYGNFFCPEDQKPSRNDSLDHEEVDVCIPTNYAGYVYWGEYPLSFAGTIKPGSFILKVYYNNTFFPAVLSQEECFRLILSRGANPDLVDTNGCTVTHIMVVYDNMRMFDLAVECGATIATTNNQEMTPLTVAAFLARKDMFFHIANIEREVYWQIGNVCCSAYPIEQMDSINSKNGQLQTQSALNLIVFGALIEHLDLIEGIIVDLLQTKWKSFIKKEFFRQLTIFALYFFLASFCYITRPIVPPANCINETIALLNVTNLTSYDPSIEELLTTLGGDNEDLYTDVTSSPDYLTTLNVTNMTTLAPSSSSDDSESKCPDGMVLEDEDKCYMNKYDTLWKQVRLGCEVLVLVWAIYYIAKAVREFTFLPLPIFIENMTLCPSRVTFLLGCVLSCFTVPFRVFCMPEEENALALIVMLLTGFYFLFFCR